MKGISAERVRELLDYDRNTGVFVGLDGTREQFQCPESKITNLSPAGTIRAGFFIGESP